MRVCKEYCKRNDIRIVHTYIDRAKSASHGVAKRTEFLQMISDAQHGNFDAIVVYKLDRFSRNRYDSAHYKAKLKKYGVRLISATENLTDSPESIILESVLEGMAEFYSAELSQKIRRGQRESVAKHKPVGGVVPLGYRFENEKYVVDEATAPVVKEIFQRYASGERAVDIAKSLNARGYRTAKGAVFTKSSFHRMLTNKRYLGYYVFKDQEEPGILPPLVDEETWNAVQKRIALNKKCPGAMKAKEPYLLLDKLICGHCGSKMIGDGGTSKTGAVYHYYVCQHRKKRHACDKKPVPKRLIEDAVVDDILETMTDDFIAELAKAAVEENNRILAEDQTLKNLTDKIEDIEHRLRNLYRAFEMTDDVPQTIIDRIRELEKEKSQTVKDLADAEKMIIRLDEDMVIFWLSRFRDGDYNDEGFRRSLVDHFINSVTVWDDPDDGWRLEIIYNITDSPHGRQITVDDLPSSDFTGIAPVCLQKTNSLAFAKRRILERETA